MSIRFHTTAMIFDQSRGLKIIVKYIQMVYDPI